MRRPAKTKERIMAYNYKVYAEKGETIYLRFKHGDVYIVENEKGNKFSMHKDKIEFDGGVSETDSTEQTEDAILD